MRDVFLFLHHELASGTHQNFGSRPNCPFPTLVMSLSNSGVGLIGGWLGCLYWLNKLSVSKTFFHISLKVVQPFWTFQVVILKQLPHAIF